MMTMIPFNFIIVVCCFYATPCSGPVAKVVYVAHKLIILLLWRLQITIQLNTLISICLGASPQSPVDPTPLNNRGSTW